jgi:hypothetical protein
MAFDIFSTASLNYTVQNLFAEATQFLLNRFFPGVIQSQVEEIHFDRITGARRIAPFCSPLVEGKIVESLGYTTAVFKPAYVKDKRVFDSNRPFRRLPGEQIGGVLNPAERMARLVVEDQKDQLGMLHRRLEVMAGEILATGAVTISGDKYPTTVVNYGRDAALTITLTAGARWSQAGTDPLADLETWANLVLTKTGAMPLDVVMSQDAWKVFRNNAAVLAYINRFNLLGTTLVPNTMTKEGAVSMGGIAGFNIWVYQGLYYDDVTAATKQILPAFAVLLAAPELEGYQAYGAIRDEQAGFQATQSFSKSWIEEDPAVRYIMLQSAPLLVPLRPNAMVAATIN